MNILSSALRKLTRLAGDETSNCCEASSEGVTTNVTATDGLKQNLSFIKDKVEETLPDQNSERIFLLRMDTDWYDSALYKLGELSHILTVKFIHIIHEFSDWSGTSKVVDEYFSKHTIRFNLSRNNDRTWRGIKLA